LSELFFHEMTISTPPRRPRTGVAALMATPGPAVALTKCVGSPFSTTPIATTLDHELRLLRPRIEAVIPLRGGLMIRIGIHEAKVRKPESLVEQRLVGVEIVGTGQVAKLAAFIALPHLQPIKRAPRGWVSKALYLWVTR
jgi:hypothetical protein